jgi:hypothetical protein
MFDIMHISLYFRHHNTSITPYQHTVRLFPIVEQFALCIQHQNYELFMTKEMILI